ncbi:MAG: AsmA family protein, partial [Alphaproteobacteria bacterium]
KIKIDRSALRVTLTGGRLVLDLSELALYQGAGKARIVVDASKPVLGIEESFELAGIQAEPFLRDAAEIDKLRGTANAKIRVKGRGRSQLDIVKSLDGDGAVTFTDGAIKGLNIASMMRSISPDSLIKGVNPAQKTDFSELSGTFVIRRGILENKDLKMLSPVLRVTGAGTSDLPARTVNYRIEPKAVATLKGQGGAADKRGLVVPIMVTGPWHNLSYQPDLKALLQIGPEGVVGMVKSLTEGVKGGGIKGLLETLTGQGGAAPAQRQPAEQQPAEQQPAEQPAQPLIDPKDPIGTLRKLIPGFGN